MEVTESTKDLVRIKHVFHLKICVVLKRARARAQTHKTQYAKIGVLVILWAVGFKKSIIIILSIEGRVFILW